MYNRGSRCREFGDLGTTSGGCDIWVDPWKVVV